MTQVTIPSGQTKSQAIEMSMRTLATIGIPSVMSGSQLTFEGSFDGVLFRPIQIGGAPYAEPITVSTISRIDASSFSTFSHIKIVSGATEGADRILDVGFDRLYA